MPKFQASISVYRAAKLPPLQPAPCYPKIFQIYLCLVVLRQLPPSQPAPCYSEITTRAKTPPSCEIPTREMLMIPLNRKNRLKSVGYFRNLPHISDKRVPKPWFPTPIPSAHPFVHRGRENPRRTPTPCSVRHPAGASSPTTSSTATPRRPSSIVPDEDHLIVPPVQPPRPPPPRNCPDVPLVFRANSHGFHGVVDLGCPMHHGRHRAILLDLWRQQRCRI